MRMTARVCPTPDRSPAAVVACLLRLAEAIQADLFDVDDVTGPPMILIEPAENAARVYQALSLDVADEPEVAAYCAARPQGYLIGFAVTHEDAP